jgi:hypothetical protein
MIVTNEKNSASLIELIQHIQAYASSYFPQWAEMDIRVELIGEKSLYHSKFYRFIISADDEQKFVLAKVYFNVNAQNRQDNYDENRPRISSKTDPDLKVQYQYEALTAIHNHFSSLKDPRFGTVRVLDFILRQKAIIMEEVQGLTLKQLIFKTSRLQPTPVRAVIDSAFQHTGAWLREYHMSTKQNYTKGVLSYRDEYIRNLYKFTDFLSERLSEKPYFKKLTTFVVRLSLNTLPEKFPLGLRHGDFALRNIIVGPENRVTGIDTLSKENTAIYEDIAYFLVSLQIIKIQVFSIGIAINPKKLRVYKKQFLKGYFGLDPIPRIEIYLFEILVLLETWCSKLAYIDNKLDRKYAIIRLPVFKLMNIFFQRKIDRLLKDIER